MSFATEGFSALMSFLAIDCHSAQCQDTHKPMPRRGSAAAVARCAQVHADDEDPCHAVTISADADNERRNAKAQNDKSNPRRQARNDVVRGLISGRRRPLEA